MERKTHIASNEYTDIKKIMEVENSEIWKKNILNSFIIRTSQNVKTKKLKNNFNPLGASVVLI